jgi:hypothetical protein
MPSNAEVTLIVMRAISPKPAHSTDAIAYPDFDVSNSNTEQPFQRSKDTHGTKYCAAHIPRDP